MISYKPLRKLLVERDLTGNDLKQMTQISSATLAKLNSDKYVSLSIIDKICKYLNCEITDVLKYEKKKNEKMKK